jgi:hypothetical protein
MNYTYEVSGLATNGQTWTTNGKVTTEKAGQFMLAINDAMMQSFNQLTNGKAIYGKPGVGCDGPYTITKVLLELVTH